MRRVLLNLTLLVSLLFAQNEENTVFNFLRQPLDAMSIGQGETGSAAMVGYQAYMFNPAHINEIQLWDVFYSLQSLGRGSNPSQGYFSTGAAAKTESGQSFGILLRRFNFGLTTLEDGRSSDIYDMSVGLTYGQSFGEQLSGGITLRYLRSVSSEAFTINTMAADVGVKWTGLFPSATLTKAGEVNEAIQNLRLENDPPGIHFGVALLNVGPNVRYQEADAEQSIPQQFRAGLNWQAISFAKFGLKAAFDLEKELVKGSAGQFDSFASALVTSWTDEPLRKATYHFGIEAKVISILTLRYGFLHQPFQTEFDKTTATVGAGIDTKYISLHFGQWLGDAIDNLQNDSYVISVRVGNYRQ